VKISPFSSVSRQVHPRLTPLWVCAKRAEGIRQSPGCRETRRHYLQVGIAAQRCASPTHCLTATHWLLCASAVPCGKPYACGTAAPIGYAYGTPDGLSRFGRALCAYASSCSLWNPSTGLTNRCASTFTQSFLSQIG
jgi:hypothetical protein